MLLLKAVFPLSMSPALNNVQGHVYKLQEQVKNKTSWYFWTSLFPQGFLYLWLKIFRPTVRLFLDKNFSHWLCSRCCNFKDEHLLHSGKLLIQMTITPLDFQLVDHRLALWRIYKTYSRLLTFRKSWYWASPNGALRSFLRPWGDAALSWILAHGLIPRSPESLLAKWKEILWGPMHRKHLKNISSAVQILCCLPPHLEILFDAVELARSSRDLASPQKKLLFWWNSCSLLDVRLLPPAYWRPRYFDARWRVLLRTEGLS